MLRIKIKQIKFFENNSFGLYLSNNQGFNILKHKCDKGPKIIIKKRSQKKSDNLAIFLKEYIQIAK